MDALQELTMPDLDLDLDAIENLLRQNVVNPLRPLRFDDQCRALIAECRRLRHVLLVKATYAAYDRSNEQAQPFRGIPAGVSVSRIDTALTVPEGSEPHPDVCKF